jgi:hypothetical protein
MKRGATLAAIDDAIWIVLDRRDVLCADVTLRIDPHGGDAGGAKASIPRGVRCALANARGKEKLSGGDVKMTEAYRARHAAVSAASALHGSHHPES